MKRIFLRFMAVFAFVLLLTGCAAASEVSYADIPDDGFPIPTLNGAPIPYEYVSLPEEGWEVTSFVYSLSAGSGFVESYKEQLREAGFVDQGSVAHIESFWRYDRGDGASLFVEMFHEESNFIINMYVNFL